MIFDRMFASGHTQRLWALLVFMPGFLATGLSAVDLSASSLEERMRSENESERCVISAIKKEGLKFEGDRLVVPFSRSALDDCVKASLDQRKNFNMGAFYMGLGLLVFSAVLGVDSKFPRRRNDDVLPPAPQV